MVYVQSNEGQEFGPFPDDSMEDWFLEENSQVIEFLCLSGLFKTWGIEEDDSCS